MDPLHGQQVLVFLLLLPLPIMVLLLVYTPQLLILVVEQLVSLDKCPIHCMDLLHVCDHLPMVSSPPLPPVHIFLLLAHTQLLLVLGTQDPLQSEQMDCKASY